MSFKQVVEQSVKSGYGAVLAYKMPNESLFHFLVPLTSIPAIAGDVTTIDYSTTANSSITKVPGKQQTNDVSITFPFTLETDHVMKKVKGQDLEYAIIDLETGLGWKFVANASYSIADISADSIMEGSLSLTISTLDDEASLDLLAVYQDTVSFTSSIPARIDLSVSGTQELNIITDPSNAVLSVSSDSDSIATIELNGKVATITGVAKGSTYVYITATESDCASWTRIAYVVVE